MKPLSIEDRELFIELLCRLNVDELRSVRNCCNSKLPEMQNEALWEWRDA